MDYENAYKELVKSLDCILELKSVKESGTIPVDDVRKLIPELRESEDEEVLNNIITAFKRIGENCEHYFSPDTAKVFEKTLKSLKDKIHPKSEWSKEDERIYQSILDDTVQENQLDGNQFAWLKSIKNRVQPKKEWSEYDKIQLSEAIQMIEANGAWIRSEDAVKKVSNWLKSLKPNHWKPSKKQIEALKNVIIDKRGPLYELYFELEKL